MQSVQEQTLHRPVVGELYNFGPRDPEAALEVYQWYYNGLALCTGKNVDINSRYPYEETEVFFFEPCNIICTYYTTRYSIPIKSDIKIRQVQEEIALTLREAQDLIQF